MSENQNFQKTKAITTANQNKEKCHEEQRRTHSENKPLDKPFEARVNASDQVLISFNLIGLESGVSLFWINQWAKYSKTKAIPGREIAPNTGANATKFFTGDQILKVSCQIGD